MSEEAYCFGTYLSARLPFERGGDIVCGKDRIVLIFSKGRNKPHHDLLTEDGKILQKITNEELDTYFEFLLHDPDFIITGCNTNDGWERAKKNYLKSVYDAKSGSGYKKRVQVLS